MDNLYEPIPMRIERIIQETDDASLRSFELSFMRDADEKAFFKAYNPGQFCQLSIFGKGEAPFGIASAAWEGKFVRFTVQNVGSFTDTIHHSRVGDSIGMRGPLGNGFPIQDWKGKDVVVIGGGCAFSTLYALTKHIMHADNRKEYGRIVVIYGARSSGLCLYKPDIKSWYQRPDMEIHQAIDVPEEGWDFHTGYVPDVVKDVAPSPKNSVAVVCGPPIMTKYTLPILVEIGFDAKDIFTSLEKKMKCGVGKCGRCNLGPKYICKDGPVFTLAELNELPLDL
ncbi:MAG: FAD/NAD(P)-binding protein [Pelolinea sp.]|nr:FAD/NAD(P)-binding protein [Pelolinea sp.]